MVDGPIGDSSYAMELYMTGATQIAPPTLPCEVLAFAAEQRVSAYLPAVLDMTRRVFPCAALSVVVEDDPEIANDRHIVIRVNAKDLTVSEALEARWQWHRELFTCSPAPLAHVFRLGLEGVR
jgi:hypothetical protein